MARIAAWSGGGVALVLLAWAALHIFVSPVHPDQPAPEDHATSACWACHFVTEAADIRE